MLGFGAPYIRGPTVYYVQGGVSLHLVSFQNEFSCSCKFADGEPIVTVLQYNLCSETSNHPIPVDSPHKWPVIWSFDICFIISRNSVLIKQSSCQWSETPRHSCLNVFPNAKVTCSKCGKCPIKCWYLIKEVNKTRKQICGSPLGNKLWTSNSLNSR